MWKDVRTNLPNVDPEQDYGAFTHSYTVLATDGQKILTAYYVRWHEEDKEYNEWKIEGRDGYNFPGVTHWLHLPDFPKTS